MICFNAYTKIINKKYILNDICAKFEFGKIYGIVGRNGSGKTMLLRAICGLIHPTHGEINIPKGTTFGALIESPGFMFDQSAIFNLQYLASLNKVIDNSVIENWMKRFDLFEFRKQKVKKYSLGMQQKLGIIQAIMENPNVIVLDEPFNGLDDISLKKAKEVLQELNKEMDTTIFIASHDREIIEELCDEIILIEEGRIAN